ncbi:hypothetical protein [Mesobacillus maritimus]|uniref:Uncharacterized protein n=1 Tax=Mesobacillus maritimus TaxID=1643336 RepID=A0ABS7K8R8_9BACI|nr:hypothetical protein [Mesobacillus maritimus]MBY0098667.1 hypothetical protein [Mesobacillus maritimus]
MFKSLAVYQFIDGQKRIVIKESFSNNDLKVIDRCYSSLAEYERYKTLFQMVLDNYLDLTKYLEKQENDEKHSEDSIKKIGFHANRLTINYLSSAKLFIEHTEKKLKSKYGNNSQEFKDWKSATKKEFDSSFSYRFLYHLRNYTQHYGFPIGSISRNSKIKNIMLFFVKDSLISNNYDWHRDVIRDLKEAPDKIPIFRVINEYNGCMARLYQAALKANCTTTSY